MPSGEARLKEAGEVVVPYVSRWWKRDAQAREIIFTRLDGSGKKAMRERPRGETKEGPWRTADESQ